LIRHVLGQRFVEVREATNGDAFEELVCNPPLKTTLIASHEKNTLFPGNPVQTFSNWIPFDKNVIVILEKEHSNNFNPVTVFFKLWKNHLAKYIRYRVSLSGKNIGDFHGELPPFYLDINARPQRGISGVPELMIPRQIALGAIDSGVQGSHGQQGAIVPVGRHLGKGVNQT
jgi:hypothetical protein